MLDPLLRRFAEAMDETEARCELDMIIEQHALPLARAIAARKLRSYRDDRRSSSANDREDVAAEAMLALMERLQAVRLAPAEAPIENFVNYAATVIHSVCAHHIRRRYPERTRLKNRLRYVFSVDRRLALWTTGNDEVAVGLAAWHGREINPGGEAKVRNSIERESLNWERMKQAELTIAICRVLTAVDEPVEFEWLVTAAVLAAGIIEPRDTHDVALLTSAEPAQDMLADQRRFLARLWEEIPSLPLRQRVALLLNLRDANGSGLLWLLPVLGVATLRDIARVLEAPDGEFASLWREIPLDDAAIAERLACSRQQVINLRMSARKRLRNHVGDLIDVISSLRASQGNLVRISASLKNKG